MRFKKNVLKCFRTVGGGGGVNITDPEGGPTATGMILEGGTAEKKLPSTPLHRLINGTVLSIQATHKTSSSTCNVLLSSFLVRSNRTTLQT